MSITITLVRGFQKQIEGMMDRIKEFDGYDEEDYNPYYDAVSSLDDAWDSLHYILRSIENG